MIYTIYLSFMVLTIIIASINFDSYLTGTEDYIKSLDFDGWVHCYVNHCCKAPDYYPEEFNRAAKETLRQTLHMEKDDINENNAKLVYLHLLNVFT